MREDMPGALSGARDMSELENFDWPVPDDLDYSGLGAFVMFHSCGMIFPLIERLIDIGVDILESSALFLLPLSKSISC